MKVNKELNELIRYHKELCKKSEIHYIITDSYNETFCSDFIASSFRNYGNFGQRSKESCWIVSFNQTYNVIYYDLFEKKEIKLFPAGIKKIVYKSINHERI